MTQVETHPSPRTTRGPKALALLASLALGAAALGQSRPTSIQPWFEGQTVLDFHLGGAAHNEGGIAGGTLGPQGAGDHVIAQQCPNGGWNWPHGGCASTFNNITAPICEGLLQGYLATGDVDFLNAAIDGGDYDLTYQYGNGESRLSAFTAAFLRRLSQMTGNAVYSSFAETAFFDELAASTYGPSDLNTAAWIAALQAGRSGGLINLRPWDLHQLPWVAGQIGNPGQQNAFRDAVLDGLSTLDGVQPFINPNYYGEIIGLAGGVRGLALNGTITFPAINSPQYALINGYTTLCQLADALALLQQPNGSWWWTANAGGASDEDTQTTAYCVLALIAAENAGCGPYAAEIALGRNYLKSLQDLDGGYFTFPPAGAHNIEVDGEALWAIGVSSDVTLIAPTCTTSSTITVEIDKSVTTNVVVGGQFFLSYDPTKLSAPVVAAGDPPFTNLIDSDVSVAGEVFVATGIPLAGAGTSDPGTMARITFTVVGTACNLADLVTWRSNVPPTRLSDEDGVPILPNLSDLGAITLDSTPPVIVGLPDVTVDCDASDLYYAPVPPPPGQPGSRLGTANGGIEIEYNTGFPEAPANQAYFKAQLTHTNTNGMQLSFSTALLPPYNFPGVTWAAIFGDQTQFGFDMVLPAPTSNGAPPVPFLSAYDNTNNNCANAFVTPNFIWAINDYNALGGPAVSSCIINSLFRSDGLGLGPIPPAPAVTLTKNIVTLSGTVYTADISGILQSDNVIHWFNPATPHSPVSNFLLNGKIYFDATLTYDSNGDPGNDGDFYAGAIDLSFNSPFSTGSQNVGVPTVSDNCTLQPSVTFVDAVAPGGCAQEMIITRTWTATDACGNSSSDVQVVTVQDNTAPVVVYCPPDITADADVGTCSKTLTLLEIGEGLAQDGCEPSAVVPVAMVGSRPGAVPLTNPYPTGTTVITWTATDACGNVSTCTQDITVIGVNDMYVDVSMEFPVASMDFTRCITFQLWDCPGGLPLATVSTDVTFVDGVATNVPIEIPCSASGYDCITARDVKHTLRATGSIVSNGVSYDADFVSAGNVLVPGNLNGDIFIDILDFGIFVGQYLDNVGPNTLCGHVGFHADFSGNGFVGPEDYPFISNNFLEFNEGNCCTSVPDSNDGGGFGIRAAGPITRISVKELRRLGLHELIPADLNRDGWLDTKDVAVFENGG